MTSKPNGQVDGIGQSAEEISPAEITAEITKAIPKFGQLPEKDRQLVVQIAMKTQSFSGPLPHPQMLHGYEDACPGAARAILDMATGDLAHVQDMQRKSFAEDARRVGRNFWYKLSGLIFGFIACMSLIAVAGLMVWTGHPIEGGVFGGASIATIAGTFIWGTRKRPKAENAEPQKKPPAKGRRR